MTRRRRHHDEDSLFAYLDQQDRRIHLVGRIVEIAVIGLVLVLITLMVLVAGAWDTVAAAARGLLSQIGARP